MNIHNHFERYEPVLILTFLPRSMVADAAFFSISLAGISSGRSDNSVGSYPGY